MRLIVQNGTDKIGKEERASKNSISLFGTHLNPKKIFEKASHYIEKFMLRSLALQLFQKLAKFWKESHHSFSFVNVIIE
jgi:hypothetical protein